jgi:hypothetical protein
MPTLHDPEAVRRAATVDINVFAGIVMPSIAVYEFPEFYKHLWVLCIQQCLELSPTNKLFKLLLVLPRGHAKTTFIKLLCAYLIIHRIFDYILVVCASDKNAANFIESIDRMLSHQNVRQLYGDWEVGISEHNASQIVSAFMGRQCILQAASILSGEIRGSNKLDIRPDFIVCDDVQTREVAVSVPRTAEVEDALVATVFKAKSPHRCGLIYLGNSYPRNCIADKLAASGEFITLRTGAILASGEALWPALHSFEALSAEWRLDCALGKGHLWMAEVQNQPLESDGLQPLFPDGTCPLSVVPPEIEQLGAFVTIDPAGRKKNSDATVIAGHRVWEDMLFELANIDASIRNPQQTIFAALDMAQKVDAPIIFVEDVAYQETLAFWGNSVLETLGLQEQYRFIGLPVGGASKLSRIRAWVGELLAGRYVITDQDTRQQVLYQGLQFKSERADNTDDILDASAHGAIVRNKHLQLVLAAYESRRRLVDHTEVPVTTGGSIDNTFLSLHRHYHG